MRDAPKRKWPPIISGAERSHWIVLRDIAITALVWGVFFLLLEGEMQFARRALSLLGLRSAENIDSSVENALPHMWPTIAVIVVLVTILGGATIFSRAQRNRALRQPQPAPVPDEDLARDLGLTERALHDIRQQNIVVLDVNEQGWISLHRD
jgi:poly-beta-1,6-N-acetyl-D-glucosamine biosynthesis protein PgaD